MVNGILKYVVLIGFILMMNTIIVSAINVTECGTLSIDGGIYNLTQNINSSGTCIEITANNITFDGNGYIITMDYESGIFGKGIYINNANNIIIQNTNIYGNFVQSHQIDINNLDNITIYNNTLRGISTDGIYIDNVNNINISNNTIDGLYTGIFSFYVNNVLSSYNNISITFDAYDMFVLNDMISINDSFSTTSDDSNVGNIFMGQVDNITFYEPIFDSVTYDYFMSNIATNITLYKCNAINESVKMRKSGMKITQICNDGNLMMFNDTNITQNVTITNTNTNISATDSDYEVVMNSVNMTTSTNISIIDIKILEFGDTIDTKYKKSFIASASVPTVKLSTIIGDFPSLTPIYVIKDGKINKKQTTNSGGLLTLILTGWSEHTFDVLTELPQIIEVNNSNYILQYNTSDMNNYTATINCSVNNSEVGIITTYMPIINWINNTGFGYNITGDNIISYEFTNNSTTGVIDINVKLNGTSNFTISPSANDKKNYPIVLLAGGGLFGLLTLLALRGFKIIKL